jgi:hypothetical protein
VLTFTAPFLVERPSPNLRTIGRVNNK